MTFLQRLFIYFSIFDIVCVFFACRTKRPNKGFILTASLLVAVNVIVILSLGCESIKSAKNIFTAFYLVLPWLFFGTALTLSFTDTRVGRKLYVIPTLIISLYQTAIMLSNAFGGKILVYSRIIMFGKMWWAARVGNKTNIFMSMLCYRSLIVISAAYLVGLILYIGIHTAKIYRVQYYVLAFIQVELGVLCFMTENNTWPVFILAIIMNTVCYVVFYIICFLPDIILRNWATMSFANEMSDGFILFDGHDDLLYMNEVIKQTLSPWLLATFTRRENVEEWMNEKEDIDGNEVLVYKDSGSRIYFRTKKSEIIKKGYKIATIYMLHDATESIRQVKAMAKANLELERAAKMKSDFLANMSHEIRTPMNAVIGMVEIALREELPATVEDCLIQIRHSGRSLLNIINDILDFSKIEAGKMTIMPEEYEPLSLFNDVANVLVTRTGGKDVRIFVDIDNNLPHTLIGDPVRIRQVLINIANNAVKFTEKGKVEIIVNCMPCGEDRIMMLVHVKDTGMGIKDEDLKKLFVSFQQVDSKRNRKVEGTGLGLVISKSLCEAMGGNIGVDSEYGKGSDFWFSIPQKIAKSSKDLVVSDHENKRLLCVDYDGRVDSYFEREAAKFGVSFECLKSLKDYKPTGKKDFLFFPVKLYGDELVKFIDSNEGLTGIACVPFNSEFKSTHKNIHVVRRPLTTLAVMLMLEGKDQSEYTVGNSEKTVIQFTAPTAEILIVDDNDINITIAEGLLKPLKMKVRSALSGAEALKITEKEAFDIILMDHMMPEMDGVETTYAIRNGSGPCKDKPIIALTANVIEDAKAMFIKEGMNDLIAKPIDMHDLMAKLRQWLPAEKIIDVTPEDGNSAEAEAAPAENVAYDCLDTEKALQSLGSAELYKKITGDYYKGGAKALEAIKLSYDNEDWEDYTRRVHTLKSSSRQIGAFELGDDAEALEKAGKAGDIGFIKDHADALNASYRELLDKLAKYFETEEDDSEHEAITEETLKELFGELKKACDDLDMDAMEQIEEKLKGYSYAEDVKDDMAKLYEAIENVDTEACFDLMDAIEGKGSAK